MVAYFYGLITKHFKSVSRTVHVGFKLQCIKSACNLIILADAYIVAKARDLLTRQG